MAGQCALKRTINLLTSTKHVLQGPRISQVKFQPPFSGLKQSTKELMKSVNMPEKPKKPATAYLRFVAEHRQTLLKKDPSLSATQLVRKCGEDWQQLQPEVKERFSKEYEKEHAAYATKYQKYLMQLTPEHKSLLEQAKLEKNQEKEKRSTRKLIKETNKPKRPPNSYSRFISAEAKLQNLSFRDLMLTAKSKWATLSEEEKLKYQNEYKQDRKRYELQLREWEDKMLQEGKITLVRLGGGTGKVSNEKVPSRLLDKFLKAAPSKPKKTE